MTLVSAVAGYVVLLRPISRQNASIKMASPKNRNRFLKELIPLLIVVAGALFFGAVLYFFGKTWPPLKGIKKEFPLIVALVISIWWVGRWNRLPFVKACRLFFDRSLIPMTFTIAGVMIFQGVLQDSQAVADISKSFITANVPIGLVIVMLPFLVGSIAGITVAFVGTTFPIVFSLLASYGLADKTLAYTVLAYCAGYLGVLLSPLHICLILTCEFFKTDLPKIYPRLALPCAAIAVASFLSFWINQML
jgi:hypothetical protein